MFLNKRAHYNLLQFHLQEPSGVVKSWQRRDFRNLSTKALFQHLQEQQIPLTSPQQFEEIAAQFESPEEMAEGYARQIPLKEADLCFLLIFELWRRLLPEKRSISTFCDELDRQIHRYEEGGDDEEVQDIVEYFQQILEDNVDGGHSPQEVFSTLQTSCAHDLEDFFYGYILDKIEQGDLDFAAELLENFYVYMPNILWFEYLALRIEMRMGEKEVAAKRLKIIQKELEDPGLALEIMTYLAEVHDPHFEEFAEKSLPLLENEEDFIDYLTACLHYSRKKEFEEIIKEREQKDPEAPLSKRDKALRLVKKLLRD